MTLEDKCEIRQIIKEELDRKFPIILSFGVQAYAQDADAISVQGLCDHDFMDVNQNGTVPIHYL